MILPFVLLLFNSIHSKEAHINNYSQNNTIPTLFASTSHSLFPKSDLYTIPAEAFTTSGKWDTEDDYETDDVLEGSNTGSYAQYTFTGVGFMLYGNLRNGGGIKIELDGVVIDTITTQKNDLLYESPEKLEFTSHTVKFTLTTSKTIYFTKLMIVLYPSIKYKSADSIFPRDYPRQRKKFDDQKTVLMQNGKALATVVNCSLLYFGFIDSTARINIQIDHESNDVTLSSTTNNVKFQARELFKSHFPLGRHDAVIRCLQNTFKFDGYLYLPEHAYTSISDITSLITGATHSGDVWEFTSTTQKLSFQYYGTHFKIYGTITSQNFKVRINVNGMQYIFSITLHTSAQIKQALLIDSNDLGICTECNFQHVEISFESKMKICHVEYLEPCHPPSNPFSDSSLFTASKYFTRSSSFTNSNTFSKSISFSSSSSFTPSSTLRQSDHFTKSNSFNPSEPFSQSGKFTNSDSFTFSNLFSSSIQFTSSDLFASTNHFSRSDEFNPTKTFTHSDYFSESVKFSHSDSFTKTTDFSESKYFSNSISFTHSNDFSNSEFFSRSLTFSQSLLFTPSNEFPGTLSFTTSGKFTDSLSFTHSNDFSNSEFFSRSLTFSQSFLFTPSNEFPGTSPFTTSNKFTGSLSFTQSSYFSDSNSFSHSISFSNSLIFTYSSKFTGTEPFSSTTKFTQSISFTSSKLFSRSSIFSISQKFTSSNHFSQSKKFTASDIFSKSTVFTKSTHFTKSIAFSESYSFSASEKHTRKFTQSEAFTKSIKFSESSIFTPSKVFTYSDPFTPTRNRGYGNGTGNSNKGSKLPMIIGILAAVIAIIASILCIIIALIKKKKRNEQEEQLDGFGHEENVYYLKDGPNTTVPGIIGASPLALKNINADDLSYSYTYVEEEEEEEEDI